MAGMNDTYYRERASAEVPDWAYERAAELANADGSCHNVASIREWSAGEAFARYIAAHEPAPVDPLREVLDDCWHMMTGPRGKAIDDLTAELRARGVTVKEASQ